MSDSICRISIEPIRSPILLGKSNPDREPDPAERWVALDFDSSTVCRLDELRRIGPQRLPRGGSLVGESNLRVLDTEDPRLLDEVVLLSDFHKHGDERGRQSASLGLSERSPSEGKS